VNRSSGDNTQRTISPVRPCGFAQDGWKHGGKVHKPHCRRADLVSSSNHYHIGCSVTAGVVSLDKLASDTTAALSGFAAIIVVLQVGPVCLLAHLRCWRGRAARRLQGYVQVHVVVSLPYSEAVVSQFPCDLPTWHQFL